jgi:hypothetical protein
MTKKVEQKSGLFTKIALIALALSFPIGLFILNAPALIELIPKQVRSEVAVNLNNAIDAKAEEIAKIDMQILEARGELLKYEDAKMAQIKELRTLYDRIASMLGDNQKEMELQNLK